MSQRTRAHTTAGTTPKLSKKTTEGGKVTSKVEGNFSPQMLVRSLRVVAAELERDPELARRISSALASSEPDSSVATVDEAVAPGTSTFRPRLITGVSPELGPGIPDPSMLLAKRGEKGLRATLEELRLGTLHAIIREHHLDPDGKLIRQNDAAKLRKAILEAVLR